MKRRVTVWIAVTIHEVREIETFEESPDAAKQVAMKQVGKIYTGKEIRITNWAVEDLA